MINDFRFLMESERVTFSDTLALMETTSFLAGVRRERYSVQQEIAPKNKRNNELILKFGSKLRDKP